MNKTTIVFFITLFSFACGDGSSDYPENAGMEIKDMARSTLQEEPSAPDQPVKYERKIIRTADIQFEVDDGVSALADIRHEISSFQGFIMEENEETQGDRRNWRMTVRVPHHQFDTLVQVLTHNRPKIDYKRISAEDVSEVYYDMKARLENDREIEKRYLKLLDRAETVSDILEIERELGQIRSEIESKEGRLKRLDDRIALSTIHLNFYERLDYTFRPEQDYQFGERLKMALYSGWRGLISFMVVLVNLWPVFLISFIVIFLIRSRIKKKSEKQEKS